MPKNGQVSEQFAFFLYAMQKHTSCSNYETFGLDQVVGQWSAQFLVPLSKNHSLSGSHPLSWWTTWQRSKRFTVSKSQLMFSFRKMFMEGCVVVSKCTSYNWLQVFRFLPSFSPMWQVRNHNISDMHGGWPVGYGYPVWPKWRLQDSPCSIRFHQFFSPNADRRPADLTLAKALNLAISCRCDFPADTSEPRQLDPARFLHKPDFGFSHPQSSNYLKGEPTLHLHRQHRLFFSK